MNIPIEDVIELRRERKTWTEIAKIYGCNRQTVRNLANSFPGFPADLLRSMNQYHQISTGDLRGMVERGMSDAEIAKSLNMNRSAPEKWRARRGILRSPGSGGVNKLTGDQLTRIEGLLDEGYSYRAISGMTGVAPKTISRNFPGRGFDREQTKEARLMARALEKVSA